MKLLCAAASPYSAKVRMALHHVGADFEEIHVATGDNPADLLDANPLGKIPTLITDDGLTLYDSRTIMHYLDGLDEERWLYPRSPEKRVLVERMEALCDGICDALVLCVYEKRFRTPETYHQPWVDRQWDKAMRGLDWLDANPPDFGKRLNAGHFALASLLAYLMLRFPGAWEQHRVRLTQWPAAFEERFPEFHALKPQG
ncbi:glutathione S-transferase [Martelella endophytica]|uniref:Glutathione S-transferase n=1 Tax=Martelella endophytica TaxID=1486262 RepID=A0A0D5LUQ7_MAREN|nr:glutathione S-transferase [Martelella endophytica]AJY47093.1 glutathione S-transferase [Martelella endophytica]